MTEISLYRMTAKIRGQRTAPSDFPGEVHAEWLRFPYSGTSANDYRSTMSIDLGAKYIWVNGQICEYGIHIYEDHLYLWSSHFLKVNWKGIVFIIPNLLRMNWGGDRKQRDQRKGHKTSFSLNFEKLNYLERVPIEQILKTCLWLA